MYAAKMPAIEITTTSSTSVYPSNLAPCARYLAERGILFSERESVPLSGRRNQQPVVTVAITGGAAPTPDVAGR